MTKSGSQKGARVRFASPRSFGAATPAQERSIARKRRGSHRRRVAAAVLALALPISGGISAVVFAAPASAAPHNPTDAQLKAAQAKKAKAAADVGRYSALIAAADAEIVHLDGLAELAKEKYLKAIWDLNQAKIAATKAKTALTGAQQAIDTARAKYNQFIVNAYINRDGDSSGVLAASDPNVMLSRGDLLKYTNARQVNAIGDLDRATVAKSNADAAARVAVANQTTATNTANAAQQAAVSAVKGAQTQRQALAVQKISYQKSLQAAGMALTGLQSQRAAYVAWQAEQKRLAEEAARRAAAQRAAQIAAQQRQQQQNSSGGGSSNNGGGYNTPSVIGNGIWTAGKGQAAANRALQWLGERYSFAAGNYNGPTWGACVTDDAGWNDCHVFGFDCSGLAMYAWAPAGIYMPHYAASQWSYGSFHPSLNQLLPGDLLFWSSDGTVPGIHHVAIYIGNGQVVQAPQSGDVVKISYIWMDEYYGATRPGT
jgi:cell wall-associated NlpC family hydrolase